MKNAHHSLARRTIAGWIAVALLSLTPAPLHAAAPPELLNYQGVLRDSAGTPLDGPHSMVFRFFDAATAGSEILVNQPAAVSVVDGLFNVELGSGTVSDGAGAGAYTSLSEMFADFASVFLEVEVDGETLDVRTRIVSAAYALNAGKLAGRDAAEFLDTSATAQTKSGSLTLDALTIGGPLAIQSGSPGAGKVLTSDASGGATWQTPQVGSGSSALADLADRLDVSNPEDLPFAQLGSFDCTGGNTATLQFRLDGFAFGDVTGFVGQDSISEPFAYWVSIESPVNATTSLQIGKTGRIELQRGGTTSTFSGSITAFDKAGFSGGTYTYVVRVEPQLAELERSKGYRVYENLSPVDIFQIALSDEGISNWTQNVSGSYSDLTMSVQYDESPLRYLKRLTETHGLHFHFQENAAEEVLVFGDTNAAFGTTPGAVNYLGDMANPGTGEEYVSTFHARTQLETQSSIVRAYDFLNPSSFLQSSDSGPGAGVGIDYEFVAGGLESSGVSLWAQLAIDRDQVRVQEHSGTSNAASLKAGHVFTLTDTVGSGFGGSYLVTEIGHFALRDPDPTCIRYGNAFRAIPNSVTFRPERTTPKPVADGPVTAVVTGPVGETNYVDQHGRVKVQFHWDRYGANDENSSGWVRVAAPTGESDNRLFAPEIGQEVLLDFLQGDPDLPVILGEFNNGDDPPPLKDELEAKGGNLILDADADESTQSIFFSNLGSPRAQSISYDGSRFSTSAPLRLPSLSIEEGVYFDSGASWESFNGTTLFTRGGSDFSDILLYAGDTLDDGAIRIFGNSNMNFRAGNGSFNFIDGSSGNVTALLNQFGDLTLDGDISLGVGSGTGTLTLGNGSLVDTGTAIYMTAGSQPIHDLFLIAGNNTANGKISIFGDSTMRFNSGNSTYQFYPEGSSNRIMNLVQSSATQNDWKIAGANLDLYLGDSASDDVFVPGDFTVSGVKNFAQNHPEDESLAVVFTALEGDEAGTYTRGSARLEQGVAAIPLSESFGWVTHPNLGLTAHITPRGNWADLWIESVSSTELVVRSRPGGDPSAAFDYIVHGLRLGYEEFSVVQDRKLDSTVPSPESYDRYYSENPDRRAFNAAARFMDMERRFELNGGERSSDPREESLELRQAVGMHASDLPEPDADPDDLLNVPPSRLADEALPVEDAARKPIETADGIGPAAGDRLMDSEHDVTTQVEPSSRTPTGSELTAMIEVTGQVEVGDLIVVDSEDPGRMVAASRQSDTGVIGIVSGEPGSGVAPTEDGEDFSTSRSAKVPVAFSGIVYVNVDAGFGAIRVGDLLTASPTAGHAMRAAGALPGTVVAKALEPLDSGAGKIRVLVMLR